MSLPNFLLIGAQRSGTSLLSHVLSRHPEICVPRSRKEIHYFDRYYERGLGWYQSYFPRDDAATRYRAIGEVTPDYLGTPEVAARIHAALPDCRLIAILRNPVDRAYSWYKFCRRNHDERVDFIHFLEVNSTALDWGLYHKHLQRYLDLFPRDSLLVLLYEELVCDPDGEFAKLARFLGLGGPFPTSRNLLERKINASDIPRFGHAFAAARRFGGLLMRHDLNWPVRAAKGLGVPQWFGHTAPPPPLDPSTRARLAAFYQDDIDQLSILLERDLTLWSSEACDGLVGSAGV
jgi:hypothetical protein